MGNDTFEEVVRARFGRRTLLKFGAGAGATAMLGPVAGVLGAGAAAASDEVPLANSAPKGSSLSFTSIAPNRTDAVVVAEGHSWGSVISWGDPILPGGKKFDLAKQSREQQEHQFGFNCDFVKFFPLYAGNHQGLLWVNHEYTDGFMMFPDYDGDSATGKAKSTTKAIVDVELAAHGASVVKVMRQGDGSWKYLPNQWWNRRITAFTPITITGPAAGSAWMKTSTDPTGTKVEGMLNNCGGGDTPWGTVLTCEENFNQYFAHADDSSVPAKVRAAHKAYGLPAAASDRLWETVYPRFDVRKEPNEAFRFGWVVEVDAYDPKSVPKKRTALGRFKHEAATSTVSSKQKVVVYSGDDERFQCLYKFVSEGSLHPFDRSKNMDLLDSGVLYAARFDTDGTGTWLPLVWGTGPLTVANGFVDQADVLIRTRDAAAAVGATKMDRPEDVERNAVNGKVYMACTNNTNRGAGTNPGVDKANPRPANAWGHIIEIAEKYNDAGALTFSWEIFMLCGDPTKPAHGTYFAGYDPKKVSAIGAPDNIDFDSKGNLWIATDGMPNALREGTTLGPNDGVFGVPTEGSERGHLKQLFAGVVGSEVASLYVTNDDQTAFITIQHPGEGGTIAKPTSMWPDAKKDGVARPTVVAVYRKDAKPIGS